MKICLYIGLSLVFFLIAVYLLYKRERMAQELVARKAESKYRIQEMNNQLDKIQEQLDQSHNTILTFQKISIKILEFFKK